MGGKRYSKTEMEAAYAEGIMDGLRSSAMAVVVGVGLGQVDNDSGLTLVGVLERGISRGPLHVAAIKKAKAADPTSWNQSMVQR